MMSFLGELRSPQMVLLILGIVAEIQKLNVDGPTQKSRIQPDAQIYDNTNVWYFKVILLAIRTLHKKADDKFTLAPQNFRKRFF